jgi:Domain of unknown function (DUF6898)
VSAAQPREVFFEFVAIGAAVKVTAIDAATGTEVSVMGPAGAAQADLEQLAIGKLRARLMREAAKPLSR